MLQDDTGLVGEQDAGRQRRLAQRQSASGVAFPQRGLHSCIPALPGRFEFAQLRRDVARRDSLSRRCRRRGCRARAARGRSSRASSRPGGSAQRWRAGWSGGKRNRQQSVSCGSPGLSPVRNGSRFAPSSFHVRPGFTPAAASAVGRMSRLITGWSYSLAGGDAALPLHQERDANAAFEQIALHAPAGSVREVFAPYSKGASGLRARSGRSGRRCR